MLDREGEFVTADAIHTQRTVSRLIISGDPGPVRSQSGDPPIGLRSVAEPPAFVAGLDDLAAVHEPVEQGSGHLRGA